MPQLQQLSASQEPAPKEGLQQSPAQRQMASAKLTPPPTPKPLSGPKSELLASAAKKAESGGVGKNACPSRKDMAERLLTEAGDKAKEARQMGVDVAKTTFWKKMVGVVVSAVAVGVAAGLTALSFGGAAPLLGLACASMAVSVGDAVCSYRNLKNAEATANHQPLPYKPLPGGNSLLENVGYAVAKWTGKFEDDTCKTIGKVFGVGLGGGLAIASVALSFGLGTLPIALDLTAKSATALNSAVGGYAALSAVMTKDLDDDHITALGAQVHDLAGRAEENDSSLDGTEVRKDALDARALLKDARDVSGFNKDVVLGVVGFLGPIGTLVGPSLGIGSSDSPPPDLGMLRV